MDPNERKLKLKLGDAKLAKALVEAGLRNPAQIRAASNEALEAIPGVGPATRQALRRRFPRRQ